MEVTKGKSSLYYLARNKPYWIVLISGLLLGASYPPSPFNFFIFFAFVPLFVLFEVLPERVMEDKVFLPFKAFWIILFRLLTFQFLWRKNVKVFRYERKMISANAQFFRYTYLTFLIWNLIGCYWLMLTALGAKDFSEMLQNMTAGLLAVTLNPVLMSIPWQIFARFRKQMHPYYAVGCFIVFWITFEYLHFNWDLTWSWMTLGHALSPWPSFLQYIEFTGILGASIFILGANLLIYAVIRHYSHKGEWNKKWIAGALGWLIFPLLLNFIILNPNREVFQSHKSLNVRVVQPVIDPFSKFNDYSVSEQVQLFSDLIQSAPLEGTDLVVMPETAIPKFLDKSRFVTDSIVAPLWRIVDRHQLSILSGVEEYKIIRDNPPVSARRMANGAWIDYFNAATVFRPDRHMETVQKSKHVPMVERMPFLEFLSWLKEWSIDLGGAGFGSYGMPDSLHNLHLHDGTPVGVMICYESEFGDLVAEFTDQGAEMLVVVTNDGWWSQSSGYIQHAYWSALRAIENRREVARSANTGRSLFMDNMGYPRLETNWWEPGIIDSEVKLYKAKTFYVRHGNYIGKGACWLTLILVIGMIGRGILRRRM